MWEWFWTKMDGPRCFWCKERYCVERKNKHDDPVHLSCLNDEQDIDRMVDEHDKAPYVHLLLNFDVFETQQRRAKR